MQRFASGLGSDQLVLGRVTVAKPGSKVDQAQIGETLGRTQLATQLGSPRSKVSLALGLGLQVRFHFTP